MQAASNLNESINKVGVAFASSTPEILKWSEASATALLLSRQEALEAASSFGLLFRQMGVGTVESANMSEQMVQLAADLASINNIPVADALAKLQSGLIGEVRPLRDVGILLNDAAVTQEAVALGLASTTKNVTDQSKVLARYNLILEQTTLQQGDVARTLAGTANQQREFISNLENIRSGIGQVFEPIYNAFLNGINKLISDNRQWGEQVLASFAQGLANGIRYLLPILSEIRAFFTYWFEAHSPPKLLPDLAKWGTAAVNAYLQGWTKGDFGSLKELSGSIEGVLRSFVGAGQIKETDLVSRVFGSTQAVAKAVDEFHRLGSVSAESLAAIQRAAGPAGNSIAGLVKSYFDLQGATKRAADAQNELNDITSRYDRLLDPLQQSIDAVGRKQQDLRDASRVDELNQELSDPLLDWSTRQQDVLELQRLELERQQRALEAERDTAVDTSKDKVDATEKERQAAQDKYDTQQGALDQQVKTNDLITEQTNLEKRLADERQAELEKGQRLAEQLHAAMLAYQLSLVDTAGKIAILRGELGKQKEGSVEYYQTLDQINGLEKQLSDERQRDAEKLSDSQLNYRLALADTAAQIGIWREELAKTTVGSADYFDILTRIANLQKSLADSGAGGAGGGIAPLLESFKIPDDMVTSYQELGDAVDEAFKALFGGGESENPTSLADVLRESAPKPEISQDIKDFADALRTFGHAIVEVTPPFKDFMALFDPAPPKKAEDKIVEDQTSWLGTLTFNLKFWAAATKGDWETAWDEYKNYADTTETGSAQRMVVWVGEMLGTINTFLTTFQTNWVTGWTNAGTTVTTWLGGIVTTISEFSLGPAAEALLFSFFTGLSTYWNETIAPWWVEKTKWIADLLPGSEPKNPQSPLRGLGQRGEALMGNLQKGMEVGAQQLQTKFTANLAAIPAAASSSVMTDNSTVFHPGSIVIQASSYEAGSAAADGLLAKLRSKGIRMGG